MAYGAALALTVAGLAFASPAAAGTRNLDPCQVFAPCAPVLSPWVTTPANGNDVFFELNCPDRHVAVGTDVVFNGDVYALGIWAFDQNGLGDAGLDFELFQSIPRDVTFKPAVGCSSLGATFSPLAQAAGTARRHRKRVRRVRLRPGAEVRVRLGCGRGERLVHSGSGVGFYTRRPPADRIVRALRHRHRRAGSVTRTSVAAPPGVGDAERVELQVMVLCARPRGRPEPAQVPSGGLDACREFTPCQQVDGPWVTTPIHGGSIYTLGCQANNLVPVGTDAQLQDGGGDAVGVEINDGGPGLADELDFIVVDDRPQGNLTYQPAVGCLAEGATAGAAAPRATGIATPFRKRSRTIRIRPGAEVRVRLGCRRGARLVYSGSGVGFYTRRPPADRIVRALRHRHRRAGSVTRTSVAAPPGVGDDERVELQVSVLCER